MTIKRVLLHSAPPWAPSGYGLQCRYLAQALRQLGYEVAISAFGGCHETRMWNGYQILSCGVRPGGNGVIRGNYAKWNADLLILLGDLWVMDDQFAGLNFMPWLPLDCTPLGVMDKSRLDALKGPLLHPLAMSEFGQRMLADAGHVAPVLPHCTKFRPDPELGRKWRREQRVRPDLFLVSKVGVNTDDDRKAFTITLQAFAEFARGRDDVGLYLHTEAQAKKSANLAFIAQNLGLAGRHGSKVVFAEEHRRAVDGYDQAWMHGLYCATDVYDGVTRAEGFGVPVVEALACGTPVIAAANSAIPEKLTPGVDSFLIGGQREWAKHHHAWWQTPSVQELITAYELAYDAARSGGMRASAARSGACWTFDSMKARLREIMAGLEAPTDHARAFAEIYADGTWGHGQGSGPGSDPAMAPEYVQFVSGYIRANAIHSVLDLGSGDGRIWKAIREHLLEAESPRHLPAYRGLDIMKGDDIRTCELPPAELVLIKDVFQHWPNADIIAMRYRLESFPHVLITNTLSETVNRTPTNTDIPAGHWRGLNLADYPFRWPVSELLRWERRGEVKTTARLGTTAQLGTTMAALSAAQEAQTAAA